jgi:hypothetical protein
MTVHTKQKPSSREIIRKTATEQGWVRDNIADYVNFDRFTTDGGGCLEITYDRRGSVAVAHVVNTSGKGWAFLDHQNRAGVIEHLTSKGST